MGAFFTTRVTHYSGSPVDLSVADPNAIVSALHDQFMVVSALILVGIVVAGLTWRWEIRAGRSKKAAQRRAGIDKNGVPHSLRHSFATHLVEAGTDIQTVQELMGHKDVERTMRYVHVKAKLGQTVKSPVDVLWRGVKEEG